MLHEIKKLKTNMQIFGFSMLYSFSVDLDFWKTKEYVLLACESLGLPNHIFPELKKAPYGAFLIPIIKISWKYHHRHNKKIVCDIKN
jgi:hypothetical protein